MSPPPRKHFTRHDSDGAARFLTFSCYRRLPLFQHDRIKERFIDRLTTSARQRAVAVLAWVVMPEHVHLVIAPSTEGIVAGFLRSLKGGIASEVIARWRTLNAPILSHLIAGGDTCRFWQHGGGYDRIVVGELAEKIRYCHRNPITRGLCGTGVDWAWSSARAYEGRKDYIGPPIAFDAMPDLSGPLT